MTYRTRVGRAQSLSRCAFTTCLFAACILAAGATAPAPPVEPAAPPFGRGAFESLEQARRYREHQRTVAALASIAFRCLSTGALMVRFDPVTQRTVPPDASAAEACRAGCTASACVEVPLPMGSADPLYADDILETLWSYNKARFPRLRTFVTVRSGGYEQNGLGHAAGFFATLSGPDIDWLWGNRDTYLAPEEIANAIVRGGTWTRRPCHRNGGKQVWAIFAKEVNGRWEVIHAVERLSDDSAPAGELWLSRTGSIGDIAARLGELEGGIAGDVHFCIEGAP